MVEKWRSMLKPRPQPGELTSRPIPPKVEATVIEARKLLRFFAT
jgi:hypothetical protein